MIRKLRSPSAAPGGGDIVTVDAKTAKINELVDVVNAWTEIIKIIGDNFKSLAVDMKDAEQRRLDGDYD